MKIFYINVIEQNKGWGAEWFMDKGFVDNGHQTIDLDYRVNRGRLAKRFLEINKDFDSMLVQRGDDFPLELVRAVKRPRFYWASELVARRRDQDAHFSSGLYNHVFVRGSECKKTIVKNNWLSADRISILLSGFDPATHYRIDEKKDIDVLFIGGMLPRRIKIINHLKNKFKIETHKAYGLEMTKLFNRAKIVLNIHAEEELDTETRVFEVLGTGSFLLSEKLTVDNPFINGKHFVETENIKDIESKIKYYLKHEEERKQIAEQGYQEAVASHTYKSRAAQIAEVMERYIAKNCYTGSSINKETVRKYQQEEPFVYFKYKSRELYKKVKRKFHKYI